MARYVDTVPAPSVVKPMKLVVLSVSRSGTMGLYNALKVLGYRSYHAFESGLRGTRDYPMLVEAFRAHRDPNQQKYTKADFDKIWGDYDAITEISGWLAPEIIAAYLPDPSVKFLLLERDPDSWVRSFTKTLVAYSEKIDSLPYRILRKFDPFNDALFEFLQEIVVMGAGDFKTASEIGYAEQLRSEYIRRIQYVKKAVPADRLKVINLEDGLDWEDICPYLEKNIPEEPYPSHNRPDELALIISEGTWPGIRSALIKLGTGAIVLSSVAVWATQNSLFGWP
ncbi:hypothetical protein TWF694_005415 [Orbilia ellipsospora]|uniref:P-loop containing nucleoside triphosphate hydrolase protein n=1 Tax=Orbilia ellipsospora TaxID=2528407 RepID=A0AAV9WT01_9PEZI